MGRRNVVEELVASKLRGHISARENTRLLDLAENGELTAPKNAHLIWLSDAGRSLDRAKFRIDPERFLEEERVLSELPTPERHRFLELSTEAGGVEQNSGDPIDARRVAAARRERAALIRKGLRLSKSRKARARTAPSARRAPRARGVRSRAARATPQAGASSSGGSDDGGSGGGEPPPAGSAPRAALGSHGHDDEEPDCICRDECGNPGWLGHPGIAAGRCGALR